ncbi:cupin domain-containing protein [Enterobacter hormaechei]|uniref:cupin domain-containing protein n=1 Tax=Enterobacter hormaechei TaxID=158836 RepID=UPI000FDB1E5F|nr:cupin domain-containing protein [Enterobacter hormaechei]RVQ75154.1 cupin domain-containing protein [Enterobacter hormaechei]
MNVKTFRYYGAILAITLFTSAVSAKETSVAHPEKVTPLFKEAIPGLPGKSLTTVEVSFPPGAAAAPHTHPASAYLYAYVLSGEIISAVNDEKPKLFRAGESWSEAPGARHPVTRNPSKSIPAKLLVVFITNQNEHQLVLPDHK